MFADNGDQHVLRLVDFGFATPISMKITKKHLDIVGTPYYIAPEVLTEKYG